ncbi:MAG: M20 family metallopeptidase [Dehalococcoidia bacterium]|nr:M20 family metallopeptidase [Dehalococcoidia bacterium]
MADASKVPTRITTKQAPLSAQQREWVEQACAAIDEERMRAFNRDITAIHSPTGHERAASEFVAAYMREAGFDAFYQGMDEDSGNAVGRVHGSGAGASLMLYAPIDTHLTADADDVPWAGPELRPDMLPQAHVDEGGNVIGLGASNPKGMVTAMVEAAVAVKQAGVPLSGDLLAAFAGGGMPMTPPPHERQSHGLGSGVTYMLTHGVAPDFAIICKPWWAVFWEEVGLCWFKVTVRGTMGYAGIPRGVPGYRNSATDAAKVILALEEWLPEYTKRNTSGQCAPQGNISALRAGWPYRPAFPSAVTEIYVDVRCNPRASTADVAAQFGEAIDAIRAADSSLELDWEMFASYPGGSTDPDNWIIHSSMRGWEYAEGRPHEPPPQVSGQTDASAIRNLGIPTARFGMPFPPANAPKEWEGLGGMGFSYIPDLVKVTKAAIYAAVDTCTRPRGELGLA